MLQVPQLESNKCYGVSVTAVNEKGNSTPVSTNITCINVDKDSSSNVEGTYCAISIYFMEFCVDSSKDHSLLYFP